MLPLYGTSALSTFHQRIGAQPCSPGPVRLVLRAISGYGPGPAKPGNQRYYINIESDSESAVANSCCVCQICVWGFESTSLAPLALDSWNRLTATWQRHGTSDYSVAFNLSHSIEVVDSITNRVRKSCFQVQADYCSGGQRVPPTQRHERFLRYVPDSFTFLKPEEQCRSLLGPL